MVKEQLNQSNPQQSERPKLKTTLDKETIENIIKVADDKGQVFKKSGIKTHQIRNFYGAINQLKLDYEQDRNKAVNDFNKTAWEKLNRELVLLKPKLAYAKGRDGKVKPFTDFMTDAIDKTLNSDNKKAALENFFELVQAVVAYHKSYGD